MQDNEILFTEEEAASCMNKMCHSKNSSSDRLLPFSFNGDDDKKINVKDDERRSIALGLVQILKMKKYLPNAAVLIRDALKEAKDNDDIKYKCFICSRQCGTTSKFSSHFKSHFKWCFSADSSSEDDQKLPNKSKKNRNYPKRSTIVPFSSEDGSDDCLGDTESCSETDEHEYDRFEERQEKTVQRECPNFMSNNHQVSLAEKQLDSNKIDDLLCLTCLKRFSNCQNLRRHLRLHIARDSNTPEIGPERFTVAEADPFGLNGKYFCDWCPLRFVNRSAARIHEDTHRGQKTKCYICDKEYADRYTLRYHLRTHGIGRQIRCEFCAKSFSKPSRLEAHIKSNHQNIRNFVCVVCSKAFKTRIHLENHFRQHSGERPFSCGKCPDSFRHKASLMTHMRSHQGVRPFCCETCGKTFREPSTLKAHSRVHSGDKPYACSVCSKTFTQRAGLNYHKQIHKRTNEFSCENNTMALPSPPLQPGDALFHTAAGSLPSFDNLTKEICVLPSSMTKCGNSPPLTPPPPLVTSDYIPPENVVVLSNSNGSQFYPSIDMSDISNYSSHNNDETYAQYVNHPFAGHLQHHNNMYTSTCNYAQSMYSHRSNGNGGGGDSSMMLMPEHPYFIEESASCRQTELLSISNNNNNDNNFSSPPHPISFHQYQFQQNVNENIHWKS